MGVEYALTRQTGINEHSLDYNTVKALPLEPFLSSPQIHPLCYVLGFQYIIKSSGNFSGVYVFLLLFYRGGN